MPGSEVEAGDLPKHCLMMGGKHDIPVGGKPLEASGVQLMVLFLAAARCRTCNGC